MMWCTPFFPSFWRLRLPCVFPYSFNPSKRDSHKTFECRSPSTTWNADGHHVPRKEMGPNTQNTTACNRAEQQNITEKKKVCDQVYHTPPTSSPSSGCIHHTTVLNWWQAAA